MPLQDSRSSIGDEKPWIVMMYVLALSLCVARYGRCRYAEAMQRFGSDKPDTRFGLELQPLPELLPPPASSADLASDSTAVVAATALVLRCETNWAPGDTNRLRKLLAAHGPSTGASSGTDSVGADLSVIKIQVRMRIKHWRHGW